MPNWLQQSFQENTILWLALSSVIGGFVGASVRFLFDVLLPQQLQQRREIIAVKRKYAAPVFAAAADLRDRFDNMIRLVQRVEAEGWLSSTHPSNYYYYSTLYVVAKFFGWLQILRRTIVYLDFTSVKETRRFEKFLKAIEDGFTDPDLLIPSPSGSPVNTSDKWIFRFWLQAIGDLMLTRENEDYRVMDYAEFYTKIVNPEQQDFREWFAPVEAMFRSLTADDPRFKRIVATYSFLNAFAHLGDPNYLRSRQHADHWELLSDEGAMRIRTRIDSILLDQRKS